MRKISSSRGQLTLHLNVADAETQQPSPVLLGVSIDLAKGIEM